MSSAQNKALSILLLGALAASSVSCGGAPSEAAADPVTTAETSAAPAEATVFDLLPEKDYGGRAFNVLTSEGWSVETLNQLWVAEETGDVVLDSVYKRNTIVEDKYNVKIAARTVVYNDLADTVRREVQAGETNTDLISHAPTKLAPIAAEKVFVDLNELKYNDMSRPWYVKNVNDELEIAGKQYLFLTDLGYVFASTANIMLYNRDMAKEFALPDLQATALDGKWTLELFTEYMSNTASDLNGDSVMDNKDRYGIALLWNEMTDTIPYSLGQKITEKDADGKPQLVLKSERMQSIIEKLNAVFCKSDCCYLSNTAKGDTWKTQQEMFRDGQTLFCIMNISSITKRLREMQDDYAVLPMPKYDEAQKAYYTGTSIDSSCVFAVPATTPDREFTSIMLEALSAEGAELVLPAYIETGVKVKFSNDEASKEIYDLILDGRILDFGAVYDSTGMYLLFRNLMKANSTDFASEYAKLEAASIAKYDEIYNKYLEK